MITRRISNLLQVSLLLCSTLCAQTWSWQKAAAADGLTGSPASMASSPQSKKCLVAGPGRLHFWTGSTWSFVGGFTTHHNDSGSIAYDEARQCWIHSLPYVGIGGPTLCYDANGVVTGAADTRDYAGPLAYDAARSEVVGIGRGYTTILGSRATVWRKLQVPGPLGYAHDSAMCYYPPTKTVFWQGGFQGRGSVSETWEWNGQSWRKVTTQRKPGPRTSGWLVFDPNSKLLFYGGGWSGVDLHDLWTFDGIEWKQLTVVCPSDRSLVAAAYDYATQRIIAVDNGSRIWRLYQGQPATVEAFELPRFVCKGSPRLNAVGNSLPQLGTRFDTRTDSVPTGSAAVFMLGAVQPQSGGIGLFYTGNPACHVLLQPIHYSASIEQNGFANYSLAIPNESLLLCQRFYQQALVIDLNANALGLVTSNGLSCHIGL